MRIYLSLLLALFLFSRATVSAAPVEFEFLNSELTFGLEALDRGWDASIWRNGVWDSVPLRFEVEPDTLLDHQLLKDPAGLILQSTYLYSGGVLHITGPGGLDLALPLEVLEVDVPEPGGALVRPAPTPGGFGGDVYFKLGPAFLDPVTASALGIGRRILGGYGATDMSYEECSDALGDHSSDVRVACDGATYFALDVPEPTLLTLLGVGALAMIVRQRSRRSGVQSHQEPPVVS